MTSRRACLAAAAAALSAACGKSKPKENLLPETVGPWRRTSLAEQPAAGVPQPLTPSTTKRVLASAYQGPGKLDVTLYELANSASALDAVQRWRPEANSIFFYRDEYFVVVRYETADRQALNGFVRDLSQRLGPAK
jgi:hypothetical protein